MIKVAHIVTSYLSATSILATKLNALAAYQDLDVTVVTGPSSSEPRVADLRARHLTVPMTRPIRPWNDLVALWSLYRLFRRERFDIVHSHTAKAGFLAAFAARAAGVPMIVHTYHGLPFFNGQPRIAYQTYRLLESIACCFRHHVFSQNREDLGACAALMRSGTRVSYEGNGVDVRDVERRAAEHRARAEADFPPRGLRIALISRLEPVKRVDMFLQVCKWLRDMSVEYSAVVAGSGPLEAPMRAMLRELRLDSTVQILGWAPHAVSLLATSDIVVLTSEKEGIPRALMEAMALSKPVVATDVPGTRELVVHGQTGYLTPLGDARAMAQRIAALVGEATLREQLGHAGRMRVESEYNDARIAASLRDFYRTHRRAQIEPGDLAVRLTGTAACGSNQSGHDAVWTARLCRLGPRALRELRPGKSLDWYDYADLWSRFPLGKVLDYGCGTGELLERFADRATERWGVDVDAKALDTAARRPGVNVRLIGAAEPLPFDDASFDTVVISEVIEHVADERRTLDELARVLRPGGKLVLTTPHKGLLTFLDPGNFKFVAPNVHRFIHCTILGRKAYYEERFGASRCSDDGLIGDIAVQESPWHRHYSYPQIRALAPPMLRTVAWGVYFPGRRALSTLKLTLTVLTLGRTRSLPPPLTVVHRWLSRRQSQWGDQLVVLFEKQA